VSGGLFGRLLRSDRAGARHVAEYSVAATAVRCPGAEPCEPLQMSLRRKVTRLGSVADPELEAQYRAIIGTIG